MRNKFVLFLLIGVFGLATITISAQDDSTKQKIEMAIGVAKLVGQEKIVLQTNNGMLDAIIGKTTTFFQLPPDNLKLSAASDSQLSNISVTDRVLVTGTYSSDRKSLFAMKIYVVKGADIAQQQEKQRQEWQTRGIAGRVTEVDSATKMITVELRGLTGQATTLKLTPKNEIKYLRYSPESVKYSDAVESQFSAIQKDDMIHALGDKSEDGTSFQAEEILTGAFMTVAGTVKSVDSEKNEVTITDLKTKKDLIIIVKDTSLVKKFPEEIAQRMARFQAMMGGGGSEGGGDGAVRPPRRENREGGNAGQGGRNGQGMGQGGGRGRMDLNQMLNNFPTITVADLKPGEMIAVSSSKSDDLTRLTAIKLLAGVEPFITMAAMRGGQRGGGRGGVSGGLTIPGLDNVDF
jgi:hypothetical protein